MYQERVYRAIQRPADLLRYRVVVKETDLFCATKRDLKRFIEERVLFYRHQLEEYIRFRPLFIHSLSPIKPDSIAPPIIKEMIEASASIGVGPMATVAGAISEFIGRDIEAMSDEFIIENGGDIYMKTLSERVVSIYANHSPYSERIGIRIRPSEMAYGICTSSGTVGHSLSFGRADAVCIIGRSAIFADGLATHIGNIVKKKDHIPYAIEEAKRHKGVSAVVIIIAETMGAWGDIEIIPIK